MSGRGESGAKRWAQRAAALLLALLPACAAEPRFAGGALPPELLRRCEEFNGPRLYRSVPDVEGFVLRQEADEGCGAICLSLLESEPYRFVEQEMGHLREGGMGYRRGIVTQPGFYRFTRVALGDPRCAAFEAYLDAEVRNNAYRGAKHPRLAPRPRFKDTCIASERIDGFAARYEWETYTTSSDYDYGGIHTRFAIYRDRRSGEVLAEVRDHRYIANSDGRSRGCLARAADPAILHQVFLPKQ